LIHGEKLINFLSEHDIGVRSKAIELSKLDALAELEIRWRMKHLGIYYNEDVEIRIPTNPMTDSAIDLILALQITVAWAGEGLCDPQRLNWWRTDVVDEDGGGDLFQRLFPKTHQWTSLEAVRQVAVQKDQQIRLGMAQPDQVRTLFFLGFELDERFADRMISHKRNGELPQKVLPLPIDLKEQFSKPGFEAALQVPGQKIDFQVSPAGRELEGKMPEAPELWIRNLATALLPLSDRYPMPFYRLGMSHAH
jgi:hypothetical protein